jgi:tetratricopeptide (TPR) repeat protein
VTPLLLALLALQAGTPPTKAPQPSPPPLDRESALKLAAAQIAAGRRVEAARLLTSVADRYKSVRALLLLARLQSGQKDAAGALRSLERARSIAPSSEEVLSAYAQVSLAAKRPVPAILALEALTRMCPSVPQHHYLLGVALMQAGDYPAAAESLQRAQALEPDRPLTLIALGLALNGLKRYGEAAPVLSRSLELEPENVEALSAVAEAEEGSGETGAAEEHAQRALSREPGHGTANLVLGLLRMKEERYAEARDALEKAVLADPSSSKAHYQLSLAFARLNDDLNAKKQLELYKQTLAEMEARLKELRGEGGRSGGGMHP